MASVGIVVVGVTEMDLLNQVNKGDVWMEETCVMELTMKEKNDGSER